MVALSRIQSRSASAKLIIVLAKRVPIDLESGPKDGVSRSKHLSDRRYFDGLAKATKHEVTRVDRTPCCRSVTKSYFYFC